ncbi:1900_t:CDS:2, partial [Paraglomus occultum]
YGIVLDGGIYYMITEWPGKGTLYEYLKTNRNVPWTQKIRWASRLARALAFCHNKLILHHDIRSHNVIVDMNDNVRLANYHRARGMKDITTSVADETDGVRWLCPEKVMDSNLSYSKEADVYSFGMLMWEISSHEIPFVDKTVGGVYTLLRHSANLEDKDAPRPPIVSGTPKKYGKIMKKCWGQKPGHRPTMAEVVTKLELLEETYKENQQEADNHHYCSSMQESEPQHESITI